MFIFERLVGVATYASILVFVCLSLAMTKTVKQQRRILFLYTMILALMAYFYVPPETSDLYRIYRSIEAFQKYSFNSFLKTFSQNPNFGLSYILYWLVGQTGIPKLLPILTALVCYSCIFYIIHASAEKNQISGKNIAIALLFYMTTETFLSIIGGIRCMLGVSLLAFCFYRESVEKRYSVFHLLLYAFSFFIHSFSALLIALRFFVPILNAKKSILVRTMHALVLSVGVFFVLQYFGEYVESVFLSAEGYLEGDEYSYFWGYIIDVGAWCALFSVVLQVVRKRKQENILQYNTLTIFLSLCLIIAVFFYYEYTIFTRLILHISPIVCLPILMSVLQNNDDAKANSGNNTKKSWFYREVDFNVFFICISLMLLFLSCARGETSSLKFFVL